MADRYFSHEGLVTSVNRDAVANRIVNRINGVQNALFDAPSGQRNSTSRELYATVVSLVEEMTREAIKSGDEDWVQDIEAVLRVVVPNYAHHPELLSMLLTAVRETWNRERGGASSSAVLRRISSAVGGFAERIGGTLQNLGKRLKS